MDKAPDLLKVLYSTLGLGPAALFVLGVIFLTFSDNLDIKSFVFSGEKFDVMLARSGFILVIIAFALAIYNWYSSKSKIDSYKREYPLSRLDKDFFLVICGGTGYLLDNKTKEIRWIKSWQTASDLEYLGYWSHIDKPINELLTSRITTVHGQIINISVFTWGEGIHTRGTPGT